MKIVIGITVILLLAFLGSRWTFTRVRLPLAARHIYLTGTEYIAVGLCLGPSVLNLLDEATLRGLSPVLYLALGWVGMLFGLQLELTQLRRFPRQYHLVALLQGAATFIICSASFILLPGAELGAGSATPSSGPLSVAPGLVAGALGALAIPTAQSSLALVEQERGMGQHPLMELLRYVSSTDALYGLAAFGVLFALSHQTSPLGIPQLVGLQTLAGAVALGLLSGLVLQLLTRIHCSQEELLLFTMGNVVFSAGAAAYLGLSPLFVTLLAGLLLANLHGQKQRINLVLVRLEKPLYLVLLLLGGARLRLAAGLGRTLALAGAYALIRGAGKLWGGLGASMLLRQPLALPRTLGLGLLSQGGMSVAMVVSFHQAYRCPAADALLMMVLCAVVLNEAASPLLAASLLRRTQLR